MGVTSKMAAGAVAAPLILPIDATNNKHKTHISTRTRLCLCSESREAEVFFTLDGSKPDSRSRKYTAPILLPPGRVCVRATAWTRDGRQSSTVTKVFTVDEVTAQSPDSTNHSPPQIIVTNESPAPVTPTILTNQRPPQRLLLQRGTSCSERPTSCKTPDLTSKMKRSPLLRPDLRPEDSSFLKTLSRTEKNRIQRETDFLRCPDCLGPRPSDPAAVHCSLCGARVDALPATAPPAENAQMRSCVWCGSLASVSSESCFVCDASLTAQRCPQSPLHLSAGVLCSVCGAVNPHLCCSCVFCDTALSDSAPCGPALSLQCSQAGGVGHVTGWVTCRRCGASVADSAHFCSTCGAPPTQSAAANQVAVSHAPSVKAPPTAERGSQTVGLYFPSATALRTNQDQGPDQDPNRKPRSRDGLTAVSPGRGFWRQQVDHVCAHLRSHAQNHAPFRTLLGEPRLGRLVSAVVREDPQEVTLLLSFSKPRPPQNLQENLQENQKNRSRSDRAAPAGGSSVWTLSSVTEGLTSLQV